MLYRYWNDDISIFFGASEVAKAPRPARLCLRHVPRSPRGRSAAPAESDGRRSAGCCSSPGAGKMVTKKGT